VEVEVHSTLTQRRLELFVLGSGRLGRTPQPSELRCTQNLCVEAEE